MQKGYPTRIPYAELLPDFGIYLPKDIVTNQQKIATYFLLVIGCESNDFKLGATHVFFRPGKDTLIRLYNISERTVVKDLAHKIENYIDIENQQREIQRRE